MDRALELLREHGVNATSFQTLEPGLEHWFTDDGDGCVAYVDTGRAWVALGEPICERRRLPEITSAFIDAARDAGRRPRFFGLETPAEGMTNLAIGEQPLWDPAGWPAILARVRSLREQLRRARAKGVTVTEIATADLDVDHRAAIVELAGEWTASRTLALMRFAVTLDLFGHAEEKRYFIAERDGAIVGALVAVPIYARGGWLIEDLLRAGDAPNGTAELMVDAAMRALAADGAEVVTMGMAPLSGVDSRLLDAIAHHSRWLFDFEGLRAFKAKLRPDRWQPLYAAYPERERGFAAMLDILRGFAHGPLWRFGLRTLLHRRRAVVWLFAVMLIPWTALLATPAAARFFPSLEIQTGWLVYDAALFCGLAALTHRWRRPLAALLAAGAGLDFAAGVGFAATFNADQAAGFDWLPIAVAMLAPLIASVYLFFAARTH